MEIGIAEVRIKFINGISGPRRQRENALKQEIQIRVIADDPAVERVFFQDARSGYVAVVIAVKVQPVYEQRIYVQ